MKSILPGLFVLALSSTAVAQYFGIPMKDTRAVEVSIQNALIQEIRETYQGDFFIRDFKVDWSPKSFKCLQAEASEMDPDLQVGVCVINVSAFQIEAKAAIARKANGYSTSILYVNVE